MSVRFASLGSGSRGNATLVEAGNTRVMVDCGFSCNQTEKRLAKLNTAAEDIDAILVTHEHGDHISGVARFSRRFGTPVWMTAGTRTVHKGGEVAQMNVFSSHHCFAIGDLEIQPFPVPHDAREPCQFVFSDGDTRLGVLTDVGSITSHLLRALGQLDALLLETNHDPDMLASGPYPLHLQQRVGGDYGHLSNQQAAALLDRLDTGRLQHLLAAHISDKNNTPGLARQALADVLGCTADEVSIADQEQGFSWRQLS